MNNPTYESEGGQFQPRQVTFADPQIAKEAKHLDPNIDLIRQKQHRLFVFHEKYGHLPFPRLQLMARAGLIPKELANVDHLSRMRLWQSPSETMENEREAKKEKTRNPSWASRECRSTGQSYRRIRSYSPRKTHTCTISWSHRLRRSLQRFHLYPPYD